MGWNATRRSAHVGYVVQAIVNNLAPLLFVIFQTRYGLDLGSLGLLASLNFGVQLLTDGVAASIVDRLGFRLPMVCAHAFSVLGLVALGVGPLLVSDTFAVLCVAVVIYAVGGGLLEVIVSPIVEALPVSTRSKAAGMALLHSFYCWGQLGVVLITTAVVALVGEQWWWVLPLAWALVPLVNLIVLLRVPLPPTLNETERTPLRSLVTLPVFVLALALMAAGGASELTMAQWASFFAQEGSGASKVVGDVLGPGLFALLMGLGRMWHATVGARFSLSGVLMVSGIGAAICYVVASCSPWGWLSLLGCAGVGLFVAPMWPGVFSLSARRLPGGGSAMFALLALGGDLGATVGPSLAGSVGVRLSSFPLFDGLAALSGGQLRVGLVVSTLVPLLFTLGVWRMKTLKV